MLSSCSIEHELNYDVVIANVNLVDGTGDPMQSDVNVYIKGNKIARIDREEIEPENAIIDGNGKYLIPGLFDCHTHTGAYKEDFPRFIHYGVTSILITGGSKCTNNYYAEMRAMGGQDSIPAPRVFHTSQHFTMEGKHPAKTYASSNWIEGESIFYLRDTLQIESLVQQVAQYPIVGIKLTIEDGPFPPFVDRMPQEFVSKVVREANKYGLEVFAHASDKEELTMAQKAGVQNHLHYVGIDLDIESDSILMAELLKSSASMVTTLMIKKSWLYPFHPDWLERSDIDKIYNSEEIEGLKDPVLVERAMRTLKNTGWLADTVIPTLSNMTNNQIEDLRFFYNNGINVTLGTDTGNDFIFPGVSLHEEMQIMETGGFTPLEIIKMSTHNAAKMLKQLDSLGTIEVGKYADMILLDRNPVEAISNTLSINMVIKNGHPQQRMNQQRTSIKR